MLKTLFLLFSLVFRLVCEGQALYEIKAGYFFFSDDTMNKVYDKEGWDVQLCATYPLSELTCKWTLHTYGAIEYFQKAGKSLNDHQKTSLWSIPVNLGLKPVYRIQDNLQAYFALGPRYLYIHQHNNSSFVSKNNSKNGFGFFINTGLNYTLSTCLVLDIFGEYSYAKIRFHSHRPESYARNIQVGGFTFGGGLGYEF